ncbi:MAG: hypothetical protein K2K53_13260 [Oscillospiraceae bacterium]|nr:hypothetical protein [Oscillospiraceae bacterium]
MKKQKVFGPEIVKLVMELFERGIPIREIMNEVEDKFPITISESTVRRMIKGNGGVLKHDKSGRHWEKDGFPIITRKHKNPPFRLKGE